MKKGVLRPLILPLAAPRHRLQDLNSRQDAGGVCSEKGLETTPELPPKGPAPGRDGQGQEWGIVLQRERKGNPGGEATGPSVWLLGHICRPDHQHWLV